MNSGFQSRIGVWTLERVDKIFKRDCPSTKSITKNDLYSIAKKYQCDVYSDIILSYNNYLIKKDDTTIEGFEEGSIINIIEDIDIPDGSYYKYLMKKYEHIERIVFNFKYIKEKIKFAPIEFPKNIPHPGFNYNIIFFKSS